MLESGRGLLVFLVAANGKQATLLSQTPIVGQFEKFDCVWSKDSTRFYYVVGSQRGPIELCIWRNGQRQAAVVDLPTQGEPGKLAVMPGSGDLLVWARPKVLLVGASGQVRPFPNDLIRPLGQGYDLLGLDGQGRAIIATNNWPPSMLRAADLSTGAVKTIYP
jgi:hypothetical protein